MLALIAQGEHPGQRFQIPLGDDKPVTIGRGDDCDVPVPWDPFISRRHIRIRVSGGRMCLERLQDTGNAVFCDGEPVETCEMSPGASFVIGSTVFRLVSADPDGTAADDPPVEQVTFERHELLQVRFRDADRRIEVLANLPEVIRGARVDSELFHRLGNLLLAGIPGAEAVAVVERTAEGRCAVFHRDRRQETAGDFCPSARLVTDAVHRHRSVLHVWEMPDQTQDSYTQVAGFDWAFCTPVPDAHAWGLYVAGRRDGLSSHPEAAAQLKGDVRFTEIVAEVVGSVRRQTLLERQQAGLRKFFAPQVLAAIGDEPGTDLLEPRYCQATVLFCDLRGFSHRAEEARDNLLELLERVSRALEIMTERILANGGVIGDFLGDAALAFWGWPLPSDEAPLNACRAALAIRGAFDEIRARPGHPLADFETGIGIAHGNAVAGKIGTSDYVKFTVFGPVVNLASRLEGLTKKLHVPILLDEATAELVRRRLSCSEGRTRRLARVLPSGMEVPVFVSELLPPASSGSCLSDEQIAVYEAGVDHFTSGDWEAAWQCLHEMPASDRAQDFLSMLITQHSRRAPADWNGIVRLTEK